MLICLGLCNHLLIDLFTTSGADKPLEVSMGRRDVGKEVGIFGEFTREVTLPQNS